MGANMAKAKRKPRLHSDFGTPERNQHDVIVIERVGQDRIDKNKQHDEDESTANRDRAKVVYEKRDPLEVYRRNRHYTARQRDAGFVLRALYVSAGKTQNVISQYQEQIGRGSVVSLHVHSIDHEKKYKAALKTMTPNARAAVIAVCCHEEFLGYGKIRYLKAGLLRLQKHFGT